MFKKLIAESTGKSPWLFHINAGSCNGCDIEVLACLTPLVRLSVQFLLYRAAAFVSAVSGVKPLERLLEQLGDAFALVLGMTAACAALLLAALLVSISMVVM